MTSRYIIYLVDFFLGNKMNGDQTLWHGGQIFHLVMTFWIISPGRSRHFYVFLRGSHGSGVNAEPTSRCVVSWDILVTSATFVLLSLLWVVKFGLSSINSIRTFSCGHDTGWCTLNSTSDDHSFVHGRVEQGFESQSSDIEFRINRGQNCGVIRRTVQGTSPCVITTWKLPWNLWKDQISRLITVIRGQTW